MSAPSGIPMPNLYVHVLLMAPSARALRIMGSFIIEILRYKPPLQGRVFATTRHTRTRGAASSGAPIANPAVFILAMAPHPRNWPAFWLCMAHAQMNKGQSPPKRTKITYYAYVYIGGHMYAY